MTVSVWDESGNTDYCVTSLQFSCPNCPGTVLTSVSGLVVTEAGKPVSDAEITIYAALPEFPKTVVTGSDGRYNLDLVRGFDYSVSAIKGGDPLDGVSTLDLVMIQQHLLGIKTFTSPWKLIASDASNNGRVTAADLTEIRKLILGIYQEFPGTESWVFPASRQLLDPQNPFPYEKIYSVEQLQTRVDTADFVAIKMGDVNGSAAGFFDDGRIEPRSASVLNLYYEDRQAVGGELVEIPIIAGGMYDIHGVQMTIDLQRSLYRGVKSGILDVEESNLGIFNHRAITLSVAMQSAVKLKPGDVLFTLIVRAEEVTDLKNLIRITSEITKAEAYDALLAVSPVSLECRSNDSFSFHVYQNEPNPFRTMTQINYELDREYEVTLTVFDAKGTQVLTKKMEGKAGMNQCFVKRDELTSSGVLYYTISAGEQRATRKMILIE